MPANKSTESGLEYGPTVNGKMYLSKYKHRGNGDRKHKHMWQVPPDTEYNIFHYSDKENLRDVNQDYWGFLEGGTTILGEKGERIARFPCTSNIEDPWHGYPVFSVEERRRNALPPDFDLLVEQWREDGVIAKEFARKIQKEKI